jgi:Pentapeptide repeats (8 copies)
VSPVSQPSHAPNEALEATGHSAGFFLSSWVGGAVARASAWALDGRVEGDDSQVLKPTLGPLLRLYRTVRRCDLPEPDPDQGGGEMSNAFYHRGLTIEFDAHIPRLTVDGQEVPLPSDASQTVLLSQLPSFGSEALIQHAQRYVDASPDFTMRDSVRDRHVRIIKDGTARWNQWRRDFPEIRPLLYDADLEGVDLNRANLANANMIRARLRGTNLVAANLHEANLGGADLSGAHLDKANLCRTDLYETILVGACLESANLQGTQLAKTDFRGAQLVNCRIYGLSAWDLIVDDKTSQKDLVIIYEKEAEDQSGQRGEGHVVVDDLRVAQFIYLLLHNENIRHVINTVSKKAVLILGRFTPERKAILEAIREWLRKNDYVPILFDFDKPTYRDITETVQLLANMSRFVIADVTDAKSIPQELSHIIPFLPSVPVRPIILDAEYEYSMYEHWKQFASVLDVYRYQDLDQLIANIEAAIIVPVLEWEQDFGKQKGLREKNELLQARVRELEARLAKSGGV